MSAHGNGEPDPHLIAAAEAAASWARARRAAWTNVPLVVPKPSYDPLPPIEFETPPAEPPAPRPQPPPIAAAPPRPMPVPPPRPPAADPIVFAPRSAAIEPAGPEPIRLAPLAGTTAPITLAPRQAPEPVHHQPRHTPVAHDTAPPFVASGTVDHVADAAAGSTSMTTWLVRIAVAAGIVGGGVFAWPYLSGMLSSSPPAKSNTGAANAAGTKGAKPAAGNGTGALKIESNPTGAQVTVDGKPRGVTPLTLNDLAAGKHDVVLKSDAGTVRRAVTIAAGQTESLDEQIFAGWVTVYSPFEVTIAEGQKVLRPDERNQVMLAPGIHELRLVNRSLAYEAALQVDVKPGEGSNVRLTPPPSTLAVTAPEPCEVLVDGVRAGDTPLSNFSIALGTHDVVVKRANGTEKSFTVTVGTKPYTLNAQF